MSFYFVSDDRKNSFQHELFVKENNHLRGVQLFSFDELFQYSEHTNENALLFSCYQKLINQKDRFPIYQSMFCYSAFIKEIITFAKQMVLYNVSIDDLLVDTPSNKELKGILEIVLQLPLKEYEMVQQVESIQNNLMQIKDLHLVTPFSSSVFEYDFIETLKNNHPSLILEDDVTPCSSMHLYKALSSRIELEGIVQDCIQKNTPCNIVLTSFKDQFPVLKTLLDRYGISYNSLHETTILHASTMFISLAKVALYKDSEHFLDALSKDAFGKKTPVEILDFISTVMVDVNVIPPYHEILNDLYTNEKAYYLDMEEKTNAYLEKIDVYTNLLLSSLTPKEAMQNAYDVFMHTFQLNSVEELKLANQIRELLNQTILSITSFEDALFVLSLMEKTLNDKPLYQNGFVTITDLTHPVSKKETTYVVNCSGSLYPAVPLQKGLFDELYVRKVEGFPSLNKRHSMYMKQLEWITNSCNELIYSYHTADYQGKEITLAFEVERLFQQQKIWDVKTLEPYTKEKAVLDEEIASQLFFNDEGLIHSSVSRIERFFSCPYSYFIQSGLKVTDFEYANLDAGTIGSLQHKAMEVLVDRYSNKYADGTKDDIKAIVAPYFDELCKYYPHQENVFRLTELRLVNRVYESLIFLKEYSGATSFKPSVSEYEFTYPITDHVIIHGIVDRIDTYNDNFYIVDYKSSNKKLVDNMIRSGKQLQLLTYLIATKETHDMTPIGCYYYSFKPTTTNTEYGKISKKGGFEVFDISDETRHKDMMKQRRFEGATFNPLSYDEVFGDKKVFKEFFVGNLTPKSLYDYDLIKDCMETLYNYFEQQLRKGAIEIEPQESACLFCPYKPICRFKGLEEDKETIYNDVDRLKGETL